jgi:hypothetical protein
MSDGGKGDKRRPEDLESFANGYERIFGNKKAERGRFIWCESERKYIPYDEYVAPASNNAPMVFPDLPGYESPVTGQWVEGRAARREDLKRNKCIPYDPEMKKDAARTRAEIDKKADAKLHDVVAKTFYSMPEKKRRELARG